MLNHKLTTATSCPSQGAHNRQSHGTPLILAAAAAAAAAFGFSAVEPKATVLSNALPRPSGTFFLPLLGSHWSS